jgi:hypothetical protein
LFERGFGVVVWRVWWRNPLGCERLLRMGMFFLVSLGGSAGRG